MPVSTCILLDHAIDRTPPLVSPLMQVRQALDILRQAGTSYVLVAEEPKTFCSLLSERYLVSAIAQGTLSLDIPVGHIFPPDVVTAKPGEFNDLIEVREQLKRHCISHLPIVDEHQQIQGCISYDRLDELINPLDLLRLRKVREVMVAKVLSISPETVLHSVSQKMAQHQVSCLVVCHDSGDPIGIISERDVVRLWSEGADFSALTAQEVMSPGVRSVLESATLWDAYETMRGQTIRRLVVTNAAGKMVGLLTRSGLRQQVKPQEARSTLETLNRIVARQTNELDAKNKQLQRKVQDRKRAKAALQQQIARERLMTRLTQKIRESLDIQTILQTAIAEVTAFLQADQSFIYLVQDENPQGDRVAEIVTESGDYQRNQAIHQAIQALDLNFYAKGRIHSIPNLLAQDLSAQQAKCLLPLGFQATLIAPIYIKQEFWGLLLVNQEQPRQWQRQDINLLEQIVLQIGIALQQAMLYTQLELANQQLRQIASVDGLTQVANRRYFDQAFQTEWSRMRREQQPLSLIICDVDYFKLYNDSYGHQAGDD